MMERKKIPIHKSFASLTTQIIELFISVLLASNDILIHSIALWDLYIFHMLLQ